MHWKNLEIPFLSIIVTLVTNSEAAPGWPAVARHASLRGVCIESAMVGRFFAPTLKLGQDRAPAVLLLHGIPGVEQNVDLAYAVRDAGMHCLAIHYRGCWGSPGKLSLASIQEDIITAYRWMQDQDAVDKEHLAVIGHGVGGYYALKMALEGVPEGCCKLKGVVSLSPLTPQSCSLVLAGSSEAEHLDKFAPTTSISELESEWASLQPLRSVAPDRTIPLSSNGSSAAKLRVLVTSGDSDELCSLDVQEHGILEPLRARRDLDVRWQRKHLGDHSLCRYRGEAAREVVDFLLGCFELRRGACGEGIGSPWVRRQWVFDVFPLMLIAANVAGFLAGQFSTSPAGVAAAAAEAAAERRDEEEDDAEEEAKRRARARRSRDD